MNYYIKYFSPCDDKCYSIYETKPDLSKEREVYTTNSQGKVLTPRKEWQDWDSVEIMDCMFDGTEMLIMTKDDAFLEAI